MSNHGRLIRQTESLHYGYTNPQSGERTRSIHHRDKTDILKGQTSLRQQLKNHWQDRLSRSLSLQCVPLQQMPTPVNVESDRNA